MSFAYSIKAISPTNASSVPHILGFSTARSTTDDVLFELWNGSTNAALVFKIDKDGRVLGGDGTVGKPAFSFTGDADSGLYRIGANNIGLAVNGAKVVDVATTGVAITGTLSATDNTTLSGTLGVSGVASFASGTASAPSITFGSDTDTGLYRIGTNNLGVSAGGSKIIDVSATGVAVTGTFSASGAVSLSSTLTVTSTTRITGGALQTSGGTVSLPGIAFDNDTNTGIYRIGADNLGIAAGGSKIVDVATTGVAVTGTFSASGASTLTGAVTLGSTIRLPNATALLARNSTDSGDLTILSLTSSNVIQLGALASGSISILGGTLGTVEIRAGGGGTAIEVGGSAGSPTLGFYGVDPVTQQAVSGATADAALGNLLTALATLGLIVDNTTF